MEPGWPRPECIFAPPPPTIVSILSPSTCSASPHPSQPSLPAATDRESNILQLSLPSCPAPPFLLHKIPEVAERTWRMAVVVPANRSSYTVQRRAQLAATLAPSSNRVAAALPGSKCNLSAASGAIGKQRLKMNYSVSLSSLMDKRT